MATETEPKTAEPSPSAEEEWESVQIGLGKEWDLEKDGPLIAIYVDSTEIALENDKDRSSAKARIFAMPDTGEQVFLWDSYELAVALEQVGAGEKVRVTFLGRDSFSGDDGPRQVKRYKVERSKRAA